MNKKGFTLVEMLAVIVILGILGTITTVSVKNLRDKQNEKNRENVISSILSGAKMYMADNASELDKLDSNDTPVTVSVKTLKENDKYVSFDVNDKNLAGSDLSDLQDNKPEVNVIVCKDENKNITSKLKYEITVDGTTYNDCGCANQDNKKPKSDKICTRSSEN